MGKNDARFSSMLNITFLEWFAIIQRSSMPNLKEKPSYENNIRSLLSVNGVMDTS